MVAASFLTTLLFALATGIAIAAAKPVLERGSPGPLKFPLKRRSFENYKVLKHDQRRVLVHKSRTRNSRNQNKETATSTPTDFEGGLFGINIGVGDPPTFCK
jgi:hypothetical protein